MLHGRAWRGIDMSFFAAVRMGITTIRVPSPTTVTDAPLSDIRPQPWAAWAAEGRATERRERRPLGGICRTRLGREGRLVEIVDGDCLLRICLET